MICDFARNLADDDLAAIDSLEKDLGVLLIAFTCRTLDPAREDRIRRAMAELGPLLQAEPAAADEAQLERIRIAEQQLGLSLVAVRG